MESALLREVPKSPWTERIRAPMAELFMMCPIPGLNAKLPSQAANQGEEGPVPAGETEMACPILGPILDAMRRRKATNEPFAARPRFG